MQKRKILIIEDDPSTINLLHQIVLQAGYEPILARRGPEGLRLLRDFGADLILLDIMMRGMDGWTVLKRIKADELTQSVPVIIVSARAPSQQSSEVEAHAGMFDDYFIKPFEIDPLISRIAELLSAGRTGGAA
jgi:DNA-binding response OmpR family regulator